MFPGLGYSILKLIKKKRFRRNNILSVGKLLSFFINAFISATDAEKIKHTRRYFEFATDFLQKVMKTGQ